MIRKFTYRPPIKYLFVGICGLILSFIFAVAIIKGDEIWFMVICGLFLIMCLGMGIAFLTLFIKNLHLRNLLLGDDFIEIPGRWKESQRLYFSEIVNISEFNTYDNVIEIESNDGIHLIEQNWMNKKDLEYLKKVIASIKTNNP